MIILGSTNKHKVISDYCADNSINRVVVLSPSKFTFEIKIDDIHSETVSYENCIEYVYFYRLLQEIDKNTLVVINECLRTQNRNELTYNCIRNFLLNTNHKIIFQYLPQIDTIADFMILFDFDTQSRYKREPFSISLLNECTIKIEQLISFQFNEYYIPTSSSTLSKYETEKKKLVDGIGLKDPHTIPRNLHLLGGKDKALYINNLDYYIMRNDRLKIENAQTYKEDAYPNKYVVFEWCHNFIDFSDFAALSTQSNFKVMTTDLKVDKYYLQRYKDWAVRISETYQKLIEGGAVC